MKNLKRTQIPTGVSCLKCSEGEYHIKWGRNGQFFACSKFPDCTSTQDFHKKLDGTYEIVPKTYTKDPCPACGQRLIVKKGKFGKFVACEEYPNCKTALPFTIEIICPKCNTGKFAEKKSRYGRIFYGCSNYPKCENAMWDTPVNVPCEKCPSQVMGIKQSKRLGDHLKCPSCGNISTWNKEEHVETSAAIT